MLFYYERYLRSEGLQAGFEFQAKKWPVNVEERHISLLREAITALYGDTPTGDMAERRFCLRNFGGTLHASVFCVADLRKDGYNRIGTVADLVLCIPENQQETELELDAEKMFGLMKRADFPLGQSQRWHPEKIPVAGTGIPRKESADDAFCLSMRKEVLLVLDAHPETVVEMLAEDLRRALPSEARRSFSFVTAAVDWPRLLENGMFSLVGVQDSEEAAGRLAAMQHRGREICWIRPSAGQKKLPQPQGGGMDYLRRVYPVLVQKGMQDEMVASGQWLYASGLVDKEQTVSRSALCAAGLMLRAARSGESALYPTQGEKEKIAATLGVH